MKKSIDAIPAPSSTDAQKRMRRVRQRNTGVELKLRSALHRLGLRFRLHRRIIPNRTRTADIVLVGVKVAVFVDGCFWHSCPQHKTLPKANREWWREKLRANVVRDRESDRILRKLGWEVVRVWQHEDFHEAAKHIFNVVDHRKRMLIQRNQMRPQSLD
jgi:DNA mismatch endonuclease (patch repair protein)